MGNTTDDFRGSPGAFLVDPTLRDFTPKSGTAGNVTVVITGTGFQNGPVQVTFAGLSGRVPAQITGLSPTEIGVTVPMGAIDGPIEVTTNGGQSRVVTASSFNVLPPVPDIKNRDGFSPKSGPAGTVVEIYPRAGTKFVEITRVTFKNGGVPSPRIDASFQI